MYTNASKLDTLPREIMAEILWRLPVESLIRLKSLNKSWYFYIRCLIKDPGFVSNHLRRSESSSTMLLICETDCGLFDTPGKSTGLSEDILNEFVAAIAIEDGKYDAGVLHCVIKDLKFPRRLAHLLYYCLKVQCCNGIICLTNEFDPQIALYNPALCEFDTFNPSTNLDICKTEVAGIGFGCDSTGSVYKVVRFFENLRAEVFVPGGDSESWREINIGIEVKEHDVVSHAYLKGNCLWSMFDTVLCFDVGREVFYTIPLPDEVDSHYIWGFSRCKDSIYVLLNSRSGLEAWTLDVSCQGACGYSWKKLLVGKWVDNIITFRAFAFGDTECGEIIVAKYGMLESYNFYDGKAKSLSFWLKNDGVYYSSHYAESLVSIKSLNRARPT